VKQRYTPLFENYSQDTSIEQDRDKIINQLIKFKGCSSYHTSNHPHVYESNGKIINRYIYSLDCNLHVGLDFEKSTGKFICAVELDDHNHAKSYINYTPEFLEAPSTPGRGLFGRFMGASSSSREGIIPNPSPDKLVPKSKAVRLIMTGSEKFKDIEADVRRFLKDERGLGGKQLLVLLGQAGIGKSLCIEQALFRENGERLTAGEVIKKLNLNSFSSEDFKVRLEASHAIQEAKNLFTRYYTNYQKNALNSSFHEDVEDEVRGDNPYIKSEPEPEQPESEEPEESVPTKPKQDDLKLKALQRVQQILEDKLFGYKLTLADVEGTGKHSPKDPVAQLAKAAELKSNYTPQRGWLEGPSSMSDEELYKELYLSNSVPLFIDEGDFFLKGHSPLFLKATNKAPIRKLKVSTKGYVEIDDNVMPSEFYYTGRVLSAANLYKSQLDTAIESRAVILELYLSIEEFFSRLKDIINDIKKKDLPYLPAELLLYVHKFLKAMADQGVLKKFDFRSYVTLCDKLGLFLQDEINKTKEEEPEDPGSKFTVYDASSASYKAWRDGDGSRIYRRVLGKWQRSAMNLIRTTDIPDPNGDNTLSFSE
jgi:hypothetical protein